MVASVLVALLERQATPLFFPDQGTTAVSLGGC